jgi:STE24 endopeptidase
MRLALPQASLAPSYSVRHTSAIHASRSLAVAPAPLACEVVLTRRVIAFVFLFLLAGCASFAQTGSASPVPPQNVAPRENKAEPLGYVLTPERAAQAIAYARARHELYFANFAFGILGLLLLLRLRIAPAFRNWAERAAHNRFLQAVIFAPALLLTFDLWSLPGGAVGHWLARYFGQSVQGWGSWLWDQTKGEMLGLAAAVLLVWLLYAVMRRSARRWWFYAWLASLPVLVFVVFLSPLLVEPLFFRFTPLTTTQPELAAQLERVVTRAGQDIPESRMYEMNASTKLNSVNAYMTGLGASRRVVVWDTTLARMTPPEILFVFGHEMGHYVLGHIADGLVFAAAFLLVALFAGFHVFHWAVARWGAAWGLRGIGDWASLPVLLICFSVFSFLFTPLDNAYSRRLEHQADQYGMEVVHGIVPDLPGTAARAFQVLGEVDLEEPSPSWFVKIWFYNHPALSERIVFARTYDPWTKGESPRFVK